MGRKPKKPKKVEGLGRGVEAYTAKDGTISIYIRYSVKGHPYRELIGDSELAPNGGDLTIEKARRILAERKQGIKLAKLHNLPWVPPKKQEAERQAVAKEEAARAEDKRQDLLFENVVQRFLGICGNRYADPKGRKGQLARLGLFFRGRYLDELTAIDIMAYEKARLGKTGPYADWRFPVGPRVTKLEKNAFSMLYNYLHLEGRQVVNPCLAPRGNNIFNAPEPGVVTAPRRTKVIPTPEQVQMIFDAAPDATYRAALALAYYTGSRPESEWCRLTHGDIVLRGEGEMGSAFFPDTKTGIPRKVLLHPAAADAVRAIMLPRPDKASELEAWKKIPLFARRGGKGPWDRYTYRKTWKKILDTVAGSWTVVCATPPDEAPSSQEAYRLAKAKVPGYRIREGRVQRYEERDPNLRRMVMRDFRSTFTSHLPDREKYKTTVAKMQGHSEQMNDHYLEVTGPVAEALIKSLPALRTTENSSISGAKSYNGVPVVRVSGQTAPGAELAN